MELVHRKHDIGIGLAEPSAPNSASRIRLDHQYGSVVSKVKVISLGILDFVEVTLDVLLSLHRTYVLSSNREQSRIACLFVSYCKLLPQHVGLLVLVQPHQ